MTPTIEDIIALVPGSFGVSPDVVTADSKLHYLANIGKYHGYPESCTAQLVSSLNVRFHLDGRTAIKWNQVTSNTTIRELADMYFMATVLSV